MREIKVSDQIEFALVTWRRYCVWLILREVKKIKSSLLQFLVVCCLCWYLSMINHHSYISSTYRHGSQRDKKEHCKLQSISINTRLLFFLFYISEEGNQVKLNLIVQKKRDAKCQVARVKIENLIAVDSSERQLKTRVRLKNWNPYVNHRRWVSEMERKKNQISTLAAKARSMLSNYENWKKNLMQTQKSVNNSISPPLSCRPIINIDPPLCVHIQQHDK